MWGVVFSFFPPHLRKSSRGGGAGGWAWLIPFDLKFAAFRYPVFSGVRPTTVVAFAFTSKVQPTSCPIRGIPHRRRAWCLYVTRGRASPLPWAGVFDRTSREPQSLCMVCVLTPWCL